MNQDQKVVFGISEDKSVVLLGVSDKAWDYMKDGKTHTFDLRALGIPFRIVLFGGGKTKEDIKALLNKSPNVKDYGNQDFGTQTGG